MRKEQKYIYICESCGKQQDYESCFRAPCDICGKDRCEDCHAEMTIPIISGSNDMFTLQLNLCKHCANKLKDLGLNGATYPQSKEFQRDLYEILEKEKERIMEDIKEKVNNG